MTYLSKPTAKLPNGRLIVDDEFVSSVVDAVNQLNDAIANLGREIERLNRADSTRASETAALKAGLGQTKQAVSRIADAVGVIVGGI